MIDTTRVSLSHRVVVQAQHLFERTCIGIRSRMRVTTSHTLSHIDQHSRGSTNDSILMALIRHHISFNLPSMHHSSLITHHSSLITHHSSLITHHSSLITHHSSLITHHSSSISYLEEPLTNRCFIDRYNFQFRVLKKAFIVHLEHPTVWRIEQQFNTVGSRMYILRGA